MASPEAMREREGPQRLVGPAGLRTALRYLAVLPIVAVSTGASEIFYRLTGSDKLSAIFLSGVLLAAFLLGSGPAYFAAALEFAVYMFLVDPRYTFSFGSIDDFNALMVFAAVAVLTSSLTGRVRDEAARAKARQRFSTVLLEATQAFSATDDEAEIRRRLAEHLARAAGGPCVIRQRDAVVWQGAQHPDPLALALLDAVEAGDELAGSSGDWRARALRGGGKVLGVAAWRIDPAARLDASELTALDILVDTGAAALARARLAAAKSEAEARARTEDLRNALLSSISHDLRTPLASILASATSLRAYGESFDAATRADLAATVQEEAERLDASVANLLSMTRLEAGALSIRMEPFDVPEVIARTLERRRLSGRVGVDVERDAAALGDPLLFEQALGNVVDNAARYAGDTAGMAVVVCQVADQVCVSVIDEGPGVAEEERERIFEKFYRGRQAPRAPGTGLGLSIVRGLMRAMEGDASASPRRDGASGLVVTLSLRRAAA